MTSKSNTIDATHSVFGSVEFTDEIILNQLRSRDHQLLLSDHGEWLNNQGLCTISVAEALVGYKSPEDALDKLRVYLRTQKQLGDELTQVLLQHENQLLEGLRIVAESYLARTGRGLPSWGEGAEASAVPDVVLVGESGSKYRPTKYLARGSAGLVYAAERDGKPGYVLKRVYPTQLESALNEYKIATRLRGSKGCLSYVDCVHQEEKEVWLVLPEIIRSEQYGVDLREYLTNGFFQKPENIANAKQIVLELLEGLNETSKIGIIMRDVKPDNVLISKKSDGQYQAFWTDFGLAVDLGPKCDGSHLRKIETHGKDEFVRDGLVCWWYDTCKLVPRPKWHARRPPERGFADPRTSGGAHSFDTYMTGIIFTCMAIGIDLPHIDQADCKKAFEGFLGTVLEKDYLKTFELGNSMKENSDRFLSAFESTFGTKFGKALFDLTVRLLNLDPAQRPSPTHALEVLRKLL